jgi:hypothetical protein
MASRDTGTVDKLEACPSGHGTTFTRSMWSHANPAVPVAGLRLWALWVPVALGFRSEYHERNIETRKGGCGIGSRGGYAQPLSPKRALPRAGRQAPTGSVVMIGVIAGSVRHRLARRRP